MKVVANEDGSFELHEISSLEITIMFAAVSREVSSLRNVTTEMLLDSKGFQELKGCAEAMSRLLRKAAVSGCDL